MTSPRELSRSIALFAARTPTLPPATHTNSYALGTRRGAPRRARDALRGRAARVDRVGAGARGERAHGSSPSWRRTTTPITWAACDELTRALGVPLWAHAETASRVDVPVARRARGRRHDSTSTGPSPSAGRSCTRRDTRRATSASGTRTSGPSSWATWSRASGRSSSTPSTATCAPTSSSSIAWRGWTRGSRCRRTGSRSTSRRSSFAGTSRTGRCARRRSSRRSPRDARQGRRADRRGDPARRVRRRAGDQLAHRAPEPSGAPEEAGRRRARASPS